MAVVPAPGAIGVTEEKRSLTEVLADSRRERAMHADTIAAFHRLFHASKQTIGLTSFEGVPMLKNPLDLWVYGEILWDLRPTLLIETGTAYGGSALWFARQFDRIGEGKVLTIDIGTCKRPSHPRITYVEGYSSTDPELVAAVGAIAASHPRVMASLDSEHGAFHVRDEMDAYGPMVTPGQFLVVEDVDLNGRPVYIGWDDAIPGPGPAVDEWLPQHAEFERQLLAERYLISSHCWLRKRKDEDEHA